jgi:quinoprotein glucose dehydrogenase
MEANMKFRILLILSLALPLQANSWTIHAGDSGGTKFSALSQINADNVDQLEIAWTYDTGETEEIGNRYGKPSFEPTPILLPPEAGGSLVFCTSFGRAIALDPATGKQRWRYDPEVNYPTGGHVCRGVSWWQDPLLENRAHCANRIIWGTRDRRLISVDARTGESCQGFGQNGEIVLDTKAEEAQVPGGIKTTSPPVIANGVLMIGAGVKDFSHANAPTGKVKAYDVRTGEAKWTFSSIPTDPDDPAASTWPPNPTRVSGAANAWAPMSVDAELGLLYVPTSAPSPDYYGAKRPGDNRYANSLVALDISTGEVAWHFQFVHHDLWDYDTPAQPTLTDIERNGQTIAAVVQVTKQGFVFAFDRKTGEPVYKIEERPVPQGAVPGEWLSPTQPFPEESLQLLDTNITTEDAWGFTFWDQGKCEDLISGLRSEGIFTPLTTEATVYMPSALGGANWGGIAVDQKQQIAVVNLNNVATIGQLVPAHEGKSGDTHAGAGSMLAKMDGTPYAMKMESLASPFGVPCVTPPWGKLVAIDLTAGKVIWESALGSVHELGPVPAPFEINLGTPNLGGPLITGSGLVFIGATLDRRIRAFDLKTGEKLWTHKLPYDANANPMTYQQEGRQYVVIAAGGSAMMSDMAGRKLGNTIVAFSLPKE